MTNHETTTESGIMLDRRQLIAGASAVGLGAAFASMPAMAQGTPKKGGMLRLGMEGGSASDSLDPRTYADSIPIAYSLMFWNMPGRDRHQGQRHAGTGRELGVQARRDWSGSSTSARASPSAPARRWTRTT